MIKEAIINQMTARKHTIYFLAKETGVSYPTIYNFLKKDKGIRLDILENILKFYGLKINRY